MRIIPTPSLSAKVATALDFAATLLIAQMGYAFKLPFYHPAILGPAVGAAFVLFKWKDEITHELLRIYAPLNNKNKYDYYDKLLLSKIAFKIRMLQSMFEKKGGKREKEIYLMMDDSSVN